MLYQFTLLPMAYVCAYFSACLLLLRVIKTFLNRFKIFSQSFAVETYIQWKCMKSAHLPE